MGVKACRKDARSLSLRHHDRLPHGSEPDGGEVENLANRDAPRGTQIEVVEGAPK